MFPLGTVLFPHMVLPLHIFEPRYRALIQDVLEDGQEFGVVLITRGHEVGGGDARSEVGSVARIVQAEELEDGRWLAISVGTRRVRVREWLEEAPYPRAIVEELPDGELPPGPDPTELLARVEPLMRRVLAMHLELGFEGVPPTVDLDPDPDVACWQIAVFSPLTPFDAQRVLRGTQCVDRLQLLEELLADLEQVIGFRLRAEDALEDTVDDDPEEPGG
jgi:uncharacterized protein